AAARDDRRRRFARRGLPDADRAHECRRRRPGGPASRRAHAQRPARVPRAPARQLRGLSGGRPNEGPARAGLSGLGRRRPGPNRRRRPLPGQRRERAVRRPVAAGTTPARQRGPRRPTRRWHDSRVAHPNERESVTELREQIENVIHSEDVALFMKGTPQFVMCGNSSRALEALRRAGAPVTAVDILPDPRIRQELSAISSWPPIPQVFVRGEMIGGADIIEELAQNGELERTLEDKLGPDYRGDGAERVVVVA